MNMNVEDNPLMYAVIFRAEILELDVEYVDMARRMRDLAIAEYGCVEFVACTEGNTEIAISYWESEEQIQQWKQNAEHLVAQEKGRSKWYRSYTVQVVEVVRAYSSAR
jgi:heme-degrading monooxygenase HmoA